MPPIAEFSQSGEICAIAIGKTEGDYVHCGILYRYDGSDTKSYYLLHLGNPLHLFNELEHDATYGGYISNHSNFIWKPFVNVVSQLQKLVRTKCRDIANKNKALPYGIFLSNGTSFDAKGNLILGEDSDGMTCASFVKVVLKGCGINIIDETEWPDEREQDLIWLKKLIETYSIWVLNLQKEVSALSLQITKEREVVSNAQLKLSRTKKQAEIQRISASIQGLKEGKRSVFKRFRPEEVSATSYCSFNEMPIKFVYAENEKRGAEELGKELLAELV